SSRQLLDQVLVRLRPAVAQELPGVAHLSDHVEVEVANEHFVFRLRSSPDDASPRVAEVTGPVELCLVERFFHAYTIDGADPVAVRHRVGRLLQLPEIPRERLDSRGWIENQFRPLQAQLPRWFREMPVVADQQAHPADRGVPDRVAEVTRLEIELFPEAWPDVRDVRLTVLADHRPVVFDHDRRVVVDAGWRLFVERHHQHHLVFFRQLLHTPNGGTVI